VPVDPEWLLVAGDGDDLQRALFVVVPAGEGTASHVVKFSRRPDNTRPFERDEAGLRLAAAAGPVTRRHSPSHIGRGLTHAVPWSVETAAVGRPLWHLLRARAPRGRRLRLIDTIATWILQMNRETVSAPESIQPELRRLARDLADSTVSIADLTDRLGDVPGVLQHNDLGSWNVVGDWASFTVLDWESARRPGLPLWDLVYFLSDALVCLDRPRDRGQTLAATIRLLRGDSPDSVFLFTRVAAAAKELQLRPETIGPIVTLGWLHHARSAMIRATTLGVHLAHDRRSPAPALADTPTAPLSAVAGRWLHDPQLGIEWPAVRRFSRN
jgi:hypothetical protein